MAYYITRPETLNPSSVVYYTGGNTWSDNPADKATFTQSKANKIISNPNGKNGGFANATVVSE